MKKCNKCNELLPLDNFYEKSSECKKCLYDRVKINRKSILEARKRKREYLKNTYFNNFRFCKVKEILEKDLYFN